MTELQKNENKMRLTVLAHSVQLLQSVTSAPHGLVKAGHHGTSEMTRDDLDVGVYLSNSTQYRGRQNYTEAEDKGMARFFIGGGGLEIKGLKIEAELLKAKRAGGVLGEGTASHIPTS